MILKRGLLDRRVLGQSLLALSFDVGGLLSGRLAVVFAPMFKESPWILAIFPLVLTVRGSIGGILSGKIGTMLHTGEIRPQFRGNTSSFYSLLNSIFVLTFVDTIGMGLISFGLNCLFQQTSLENLVYFIVLPILTCILEMLIAVPITLSVAIKAYKSGLDPDILVYPVMSTTTDIIISAIYVSMVSLILRGGVYVVFMESLVFVIAASSTFLFIRHSKEEVFKKTLKEGTPTVLLSSLFGTVNGIGLASLRERIEEHPSILILYPALIDALGDIGSIIGSMETTKLALGYVTSFTTVLKDTVKDFLSVEAAAFLMHAIFGIAILAVGSLTNIAVNPLFVIRVALLSNVMSFLIVSLFSLAIATQTFKRGLDPDNFVIPLTTSLADTVATLSLMTTLIILGAQ